MTADHAGAPRNSKIPDRVKLRVDSARAGRSLLTGLRLDELKESLSRDIKKV